MRLVGHRASGRRGAEVKAVPGKAIVATQGLRSGDAGFVDFRKRIGTRYYFVETMAFVLEPPGHKKRNRNAIR